MRFYRQFFRLEKCIYDYLVKKGMRESAEAFASEVDLEIPTDDGKSFFKFMADLNSLLCFIFIKNCLRMMYNSG